jgi:hypothetical protein
MPFSVLKMGVVGELGASYQKAVLGRVLGAWELADRWPTKCLNS